MGTFEAVVVVIAVIQSIVVFTLVFRAKKRSQKVSGN